MDPKDDMIEILHNGLKNDTEPETFTLKNQHGNMVKKREMSPFISL